MTTPAPAPVPTPAPISAPAPPGNAWLGGETPKATARNIIDIASIGLGVTKKDREDLKQNDKKAYYRVRDESIKGMEEKFSQLTAIDDKSSVEHLAKVYSVITRFADLSRLMKQNDIDDVFTIPNSFVPHPTDVGAYVPSPAAIPINLFTHSNQVSIEVVQYATAYFLRYRADYHGENVLWSGEKILNSCDQTLRDKLVESVREWPTEFRGGPTYLHILLTLILATSEKSLRVLTDKLSRLQLTDFPGENVTQAVSFLRGAILVLRNNGQLPSDHITLVLRIFKSSSCEAFRLHVTNMDSLRELNVRTYTTEEILSNLDKKYIDLLGRGEWTPKTTTGQDSGFNLKTSEILLKIICFNCGGIGHGVNSCPHPKDEEAIALRKEIMSNYGNKNKSNNGGRGDGNRRGGNVSDPTKVPPRRGESHQKKFGDKTKFWCGKCRCWTDHYTDSHPTESGHSASSGGDPSPSVASTNVSDQSNLETSTITGDPSSIANAGLGQPGAAGHFANPTGQQNYYPPTMFNFGAAV